MAGGATQAFNPLADIRISRQAFRPAATGLQQSIQGIQSNMMAQDKMKMLAEQQALENKRADERLGFARAQEADRVNALTHKKQQEALASQLLSQVPTSTTVTTNVDKEVITSPAKPGIQGNEGLVETKETANFMNDLRKQALQSGQFSYNPVEPVVGSTVSNLPATATHSKSNSFDTNDDKTVALDNSNKVILKEYPRVPGESVRTYYERPDGSKVDAFEKWIKGYEEVDNFKDSSVDFGPLGTETNPIAPGVQSVTVSKAPASPVKPSKEEYVKEQLNLIDKSYEDVPNLIKTVKGEDAKTKTITETVTQNKKLSRDEKLSALREVVLNSKLDYSNKKDMLNNLETLIPETEKSKEAKRRNAKLWDLNAAADIKAKYGVETAEKLAEISAKYKTTDTFKALKYADDKKSKISNALALLNYGNQLFEDNDTLEMVQARAYLEAINDEIDATNKRTGSKTPRIDVPGEDFF